MLSQENPLKGIIRGSAFATVAAVLVPVQVWLYSYANFDAKSTVMAVVGGIQLISLVLSMVTLAGVRRDLRKK